jgi:rhodanese-related sulfurtransferase
MSLPQISAAKAKELIDHGAVPVDIRELDEHSRMRIAVARHAPLSRLGRLDVGNDAPAVIFRCRTGNRTATHAERLAAAISCDAFIPDGGIDGWKKAGLPVVEDSKQPIEIMRQVQIVTGSLVVVGAALGALLHPGSTPSRRSSAPGWCSPGCPAPA